MFRRSVAMPGPMGHQDAGVREQVQGRMDGLPRLGHTHQAMAGVDTPTPLDHAGYRPMQNATVARIWAGIYQYGNSVTRPRRNGYPAGQPPRSPDLSPVMLAVLIDGLKRDQT